MARKVVTEQMKEYICRTYRNKKLIADELGFSLSSIKKHSINIDSWTKYKDRAKIAASTTFKQWCAAEDVKVSGEQPFMITDDFLKYINLHRSRPLVKFTEETGLSRDEIDVAYKNARKKNFPEASQSKLSFKEWMSKSKTFNVGDKVWLKEGVRNQGWVNELERPNILTIEEMVNGNVVFVERYIDGNDIEMKESYFKENFEHAGTITEQEPALPHSFKIGDELINTNPEVYHSVKEIMYGIFNIKRITPQYIEIYTPSGYNYTINYEEPIFSHLKKFNRDNLARKPVKSKKELEEKLIEAEEAFNKREADNFNKLEASFKQTLDNKIDKLQAEYDNKLSTEINEKFVEMKETIRKKKAKQLKEAKALDNVIVEDKVKNVLDICYESKQPCLLMGPPGSGKDTILIELAAQKDQEMELIPITGDMTKDAFLGHYVLNNTGAMVWQDGPLARGLKEGKMINISEVNMAHPDILAILNNVTQMRDGKLGTLHTGNKGGEVITPHIEARIFASANPSAGNIGTKDFNQATLSRFISLNIDYLDEENEVGLLLKKFSSLFVDDIRSLVQKANEARQLKNKGKIMLDVGTRHLEKVLSLMDKGIDLFTAVKFGIVNDCQNDNDEDRIKKIFGAIKQETIENVDSEDKIPF